MANLKLPEFISRNVFDVVKENFERVKLRNHAQRIIYIGDHTIAKEDLMKVFRKSVKRCNAGYADVPVCGVLLVYDSYFIHILEGSEDTEHRQLRFLFEVEKQFLIDRKKKWEEDEAEAYRVALEAASEGRPQLLEEFNRPKSPRDERPIFIRLKILTIYHSISTRLFDSWRAIPARPPVLLGKLDLYATIDVHIEQLVICLEKIHKLCKIAAAEPDLTFEGVPANDPKMESLPEVALLDYLLASQHFFDLKATTALHRRVDDHEFYFEKVWPLQTHFTPRYLYKLKIDDSFVEQLPVMWWEKKEDEEEGEKEDRSSDSE